MRIGTLAIGCAIAALAGVASAQQPSPTATGKAVQAAPPTNASIIAGGPLGSSASSPRMSAATMPRRPIPYSQLEAYMKASPSVRASRDRWAADAALTGRPANVSATVGARTPGLAGDINLSTGATSGASTTPRSDTPAPERSIEATSPSLSGLGISGGVGLGGATVNPPASGASPTPSAGGVLE